ncbi:hypothetical protein [Pseudoalteromonas phage PH357]|nr:hypothetical protein [Pseudoalteromonas phage PH357]
MALDVNILTEAIKAIRNVDVSQGEKANDEMAQILAEAIEAFVKSGDVVIASGSSAGTYKVT